MKKIDRKIQPYYVRNSLAIRNDKKEDSANYFGV